MLKAFSKRKYASHKSQSMVLQLNNDFFFYWGITKWGSRKGIKYIFFFFSKFKLLLEFKKHSHHFFWCKQFEMILATNQKEHN